MPKFYEPVDSSLKTIPPLKWFMDGNEALFV